MKLAALDQDLVEAKSRGVAPPANIWQKCCIAFSTADLVISIRLRDNLKFVAKTADAAGQKGR
jgi:hypothetical protein